MPREIAQSRDLAAAFAPVKRPAGAPLIAAISWRNLWRNRTRTGLSAGGIAFAVMLILAARSAQVSTMSTMLDNATRMLTGHLQVQNAAYASDPALRNVIPDATAVARALAKVPGVTAVAQRVVTFALVSVGDRSYGAQVMGVDAAAERAISSIPDLLIEGRYIETPNDAVIGSVMARNLGAKTGDELVVLGSALDGGVAAMSLRVVGIIDTGTPDLDRALIQVQIAALQDAFGLGDQAHTVVARVADFMRAEAIAPDAAAAVASRESHLTVMSWQRLLPELMQSVELKRISNSFLFALIALLVTFSVFNSFLMTVFERTREFGMLLAIGMRPNGIIGVLQLEAVWLSVLGAGVGVGLGAGLIAWGAHVGIPLGEIAGDMLRRYHLPDRLYPEIDVGALLFTPLLMMLATQLAALIPALRIRRLAPVDALRVGV